MGDCSGYSGDTISESPSDFPRTARCKTRHNLPPFQLVTRLAPSIFRGISALMEGTSSLVLITGLSEAGGWGASAPNNLLKFADFVSEKAVKAKVVKRRFKFVYIRGSYQNL